MNLRGIKIIDLKHSVLDNSTVEGIEQEIGDLLAKLDKLRKTTFKPDDTKLTEKTVARDDKMASLNIMVTKLTKELEGERELVLSEQRNGIYRFKKKLYVNYRDAGRRPPWKFIWCWYSEADKYATYRDWQIQYGSTAVVFDKDRYVPEGIPVTGEGHYIYKDVILVKEDLQRYLRRINDNIKKSESGGKADLDALNAQIKAEGGGISDDYMEELLSDGGR